MLMVKIQTLKAGVKENLKVFHPCYETTRLKAGGEGGNRGWYGGMASPT